MEAHPDEGTFRAVHFASVLAPAQHPLSSPRLTVNAYRYDGVIVSVQTFLLATSTAVINKNVDQKAAQIMAYRGLYSVRQSLLLETAWLKKSAEIDKKLQENSAVTVKRQSKER